MLAGGYIALRKMKNNHTMVLSAYVNLCLMVLSLTVILCSRGMSFGYLGELSVGSWLLFLLASVLTIGDQVTKFVALKYSEASKLQKYAFLPNVWLLIVDLFFLGVHFYFW